ncbi:primary-amine oxidase [Actinoplanes sp. NPDC051470]|uniref:copper amine oxidase n=1 Tax=Actinoplanes sp. NPDC051470 TaxID=3157224 RepID=UPI003421CD96
MTYRMRAAFVTALITAAGLGVSAAPASAKAPAAPCAPESTVHETLPNGTVWDLCWRMDERAGLILENVSVAYATNPEAVQVLQSIRLAQLNVPYDSGDTEYNDLTDYGFGGGDLETLKSEDCKGGSARTGSDGSAEPRRRKVLCVSAERSGLAYRLHSYDFPEGAEEPTETIYSKQGHDLVLRAISKVGWYEYVTEYRLQDDGAISARLGATGDLSPGNYYNADQGWPIGKGARDFSAMHYHSAFWRVDFNLAGKGKEIVEQYDTRTDGQGEMAAKLTTSHQTIAKEGSFTKANQRWWRLASPSSKNADRHRRSYELVTEGGDKYEGHPETQPDVTFTNGHACEMFATGNADPECPRRQTILDFTSNNEDLKDPIMWVRVGFHHVPRDEDQSPMPLHWQGFDLLPRDFTAQNPLTPDGRKDVNGQPR